MNFNKLIGQKNLLLLPVSWLYKVGVWVYHKLFEFGIKKSYHPQLPAICVGNLSVGGTGKSPMVEYLLRLFKDDFSVAVISRGYGRKTSGFILANENTTAAEIGDEPMQFHYKFPEVSVAVGERRATAIQDLCAQLPNTEVIILDDAFQHRAVSAGLNILLTDYNNLFTKDWFLPAGTLRDLKSNYKRADIIVVTKAPNNLSTAERQRIVDDISPLPNQKVFFSTITYGAIYNIFNNNPLQLNRVASVVLVTGIANPNPLLQYLNAFELKVQHLNFGDHHHFSPKDIAQIESCYQNIAAENTMLLTTEKDAMRLREWRELYSLPFYAIPIEHQFLFDEAPEFKSLILNYVAQNQPDPLG